MDWSKASLRVNEMAVAVPVAPGDRASIKNLRWQSWQARSNFQYRNALMIQVAYICYYICIVLPTWYHHGIIMPPLRSVDGWEVDQRGRWWHWQFFFCHHEVGQRRIYQSTMIYLFFQCYRFVQVMEKRISTHRTHRNSIQQFLGPDFDLCNFYSSFIASYSPGSVWWQQPWVSAVDQRS